MVQRKIVNRTVSLLLAVILCGCCAAGVSAVAVDEQAPVYPNDGYVEKDLRTGEETYIPQSSIPVPLSGETSQPAYEGLLGEQKPNVQMRPRYVIGNDGRWLVSNTMDFPYRAIGYVYIEWPEGPPSRGTGWLFHRDKMVTAGHCVYNKGKGGWAKRLSISFAQTGYGEAGAPLGVVYSMRLATTTPWMNSQDTNMDYALVELDSHIGVLTGWFGYDYGFDVCTVGTRVTVTGYPEEVNKNIMFNQWGMSGPVLSQTDQLLYYDIDATKGQSGGPIYLSNNVAVGVHVAELRDGNRNIGKRIHRDMFNWMQTF